MKKTPKFSFWEHQDRGGLMIAGLYMLVGGLWILFSDRLAALITGNREAFMTLSIFKGWAYVLVTGVMLYLLIQRNHRNLRKSEARFHSAFDNMLESAQIIDHDGRYVYLNETAERYNQRPNRELLGKKFTEVWPGVEETPVFAAIQNCVEQQVASQLEDRFVYPDGTCNWFTLRIQPVPEGVFILSIDVSERKQAEMKAAQLKRLYVTLSQVNQTIVRVKTRNDLYRSICDLAVQFGGFSLAWIGLLDEESGDVCPVAAKGLEIKKWPFQVINLNHGPYQEGLVARAVRTAEVVTSENLQTDERTRSLHSQIKELGYKSSAAVPVRFLDRTIGVLVLVSSEEGLFKQEEELTLLSEMSLDLSFALDRMETERIKRQWADAFEHCAHGIAIGLPSSNQILTCNPAFARLQGRTIDEISSMPILDMYAPQDHEQVKERIAEADRRGKVQYEAHMLRKDGTAYPVQMDLVSVRDEHGKLLYRVATQQDITARKRAEAATEISEQRFRALTEHAPDGVLIYDSRGRVEYASPATSRTMGYSLDEILNTDPAQITHPEDLPALIMDLEELIQTPGNTIQTKYRMRHKDGSWHWLESNISNMSHVPGIAGLVFNFRDITDHIYAELLQESLYAIARAAMTTRSLDELYGTIHAILRRLLQSENFYIALYDQENDLLSFPYFVDAFDTKPSPRKSGRSLTDYVLRTRKPLLSNQENMAELIQSGEAELVGPDSVEWLGVPLIVQDQVIGVMVAQSYDPAVHFSVQEQEIMSYVSTQVASAIERKRADEKLRESEQRLKLALKAARMGVWEWNLETNAVFWSPACYQIMGVDAFDNTIEGFTDLLHPDDVNRLMQSAEKAIAEKTMFVSEFRALRPNGNTIWLRDFGQAEYDENNKHIRLVGTVEDITQHKQAEEALRESEERFRSLYENATIGIYRTTPKGQILLANPALISMLGYKSLKELAQRNLNEEGYEPGYERSIFRQEIERDGTVIGLESAWKKKDGTTIFVRESAKAIRNPEGNTLYYEGTVEDISERKQAEQALRESETRFRSLVENGSDEISIISAKGELLYESPSSNPTLGYPNGTFLEQNIFQLVHPDDVGHIQEQLARLMHDPSLHPREQFRLRHQNGSWRWVEAVGTNLLSEPSVCGIVINYHDITDRKQAEEALKQSEERHRQISNLISDYVYSGAISTDGSTKTEWVSGAFEQITGYTLEEINRLPAGFATLVLPEDMEKVMGQLSDLFEKGSLNVEYRIRRRDGEIRWMRDYMDYTAGEGSGKTARMIGAAQDITERVQAEKTLRMSENRFQLASKATNDVIWEWNANTHKLIWSENARVVFGYAPDQLGIDENWWDERIHPEDRDRIVSKMNALIAGRESNWSDEYRFRRQDGSYCYVSDRGYIEREADGKAVRMVGAMSDITERKQAEQQVKRQLRRVRALSTIDRAITSSLDMRLSLDILLSELLSQLEVDAASVLLLDSYSHSLEFVAGKGFRTSKIRNARVHLGDAGAGQVGLERKVLHVADLTTAGAQFRRADLIKEDGFVEYYAVPLVAKGQLKGVLETFHRSHLDLDLEWVNYLETLGGQAAIAIDNAQLFEGMQRSNIELITAYDATIAGWSHAMDLRDKETEGHTLRVTELTLKLAEKMGVSQQEQVHIRRGALLHDIGKLGVPDHILLKPGALTEEEWAIMRQHPNYAFEMLMPIAYLQPALDIPYCHHEKWDGTGYPRQLKGEQIPLAARIFAVVDVWDALRSDRPYRAAWSEEKTKQHIRSLSGIHFDPQVMEIFLQMLGELQS